jgi:cell division septum initiation protein DivIVA
MLPAMLAMGGAQLIGGAIKYFSGKKQHKEGKKLLNSLQYPEEQIPQEVIENQNLAKQAAATGMPSEQYANAMKNIQRQQLTALRGARDRRGGLSALSGIVGSTNDATLNLDATDARMQQQNQRTLYGINNQVAGWKDKVWDNNVRQKYLGNREYALGLMGAGNQNKAAGIDSGVAGLGYLGYGAFGKPQENDNGGF